MPHCANMCSCADIALVTSGSNIKIMEHLIHEGLEHVLETKI